MKQPLEILKEKALKYAGEAFEGHREQIFESLKVIGQCGALARQSGLLALDEAAELWEEESGLADGDSIEPGKYDEDTLELSLSERDVPLKELLIYEIRSLADAMDWDKVEEDTLAWAGKNGYSEYEWYIVYIYLTGAGSILKGVQARYYYLTFRVMVPGPWQEDYDRYCHTLVEKQQEKELADTQERVNNEFETETAIKTAFHRIFGDMDPEEMRYIIHELDYKTLAAGTAFAAEAVRNRFLENMEKRQRDLVIEEWFYRRNNSYHLSDILEAMDRMMILAGLTGKMEEIA
ncbi:FliG C-terminal domain-containing protein [Lachnospiraceae bacterium 62-35]